MAYPCAVPGINLSDYRTALPRVGWGPRCTGPFARVTINSAGAGVTVDARIAELVGLIMRRNEADGYHYRPADTGAQNCRLIAGTNVWSLHSWGVAIDENWQSNPYTSPLRTDKPAWLVQRWNRYGFAWGGHYNGSKDCLAGDTMIVTADGPRPIAELTGRDVELLSTTEDPRQSGVTTTEWVKAPVASYGFQRVYEVTVRRRGARQTVRCSPGHRWPVRAIDGSIRFVTAEALTASLRQGDTIPALQYPPVPAALDERSVAQGIVWGDGTVYNKHGGRTPQACVQLCGSKADLRTRLDPYARYWREAKHGPSAWGLPADFKSLPDPDSSLEVLAGFFAGWFACDGHISSAVGASLSSSDPRAVAWLYKVAPRLGLTITGMSMQAAGKSGYGSTKDNHQIRFRQVPAHLLLTERHVTAEQPARRWSNWTIEGVRDTGLYEETYCPTVDDRHVVAIHTPTVPLLTGQSMHFEFMGTPAQAAQATILARAELGGGAPPPPPPPTGGNVQVRADQHDLNDSGFPVGAEDGVWGPVCIAACRQFQHAAHLTEDGQMGPVTRGAIHKVPSWRGATVGDGGYPARQWQQKLKDHGWRITVDNQWGAHSTSILRQFQADKGLNMRRDGARCSESWACLYTTVN